MKKYAVIVAAGSGTRMQSATPKQFLQLKGKPVLWHTLQTFLNAYDDLQIILVLSSSHIETGTSIIRELNAEQRIRITEGGETRFHSVKNGLGLADDDSIVFVHDAVRCLVSIDLIKLCYEQAMLHGNAIPAIKSIDTIRIDNGQGPVTVDRNKVYIIQTPQTFQSALLKGCFETDYNEAFTDEATVAEACGVKINLVEGEATNIKLTRPMDMILAEALR